MNDRTCDPSRMAVRQPIPVRLDESMVALIDKIAAEMSRRAAGAEVTRSTAVRRIVERGAALVADELGIAPTETPKRPKR